MVARDESASAGLLPVKGHWGDVRIGSLLQGSKKTNDDVWKVIDSRNPEQFDHHTSPWYRIENVASGLVVSVPPRPTGYPAYFMVPEDTVDPDVEKPKYDTSDLAAHQPLSDQDQVDLLVKELGATELAHKDHETGVVTCPPYEEMGNVRAEYLTHLEVAHGIDLSAVPDDIHEITMIHGQAHSKKFKNPRPVSGGGFPHQHNYKDPKPFGDLD